MTQVATVKKIHTDGRAEVAVQRRGACAHDCADCAGCETMISAKETVVLAENRLGNQLQPGDVVVLRSDSAPVLTAAMVVYLLPFLLLFVCYALLSLLPQSLRIGLSLLAFALGVCLAVLWDRRERRRKSLGFAIVSLEGRGCSGM